MNTPNTPKEPEWLDNTRKRLEKEQPPTAQIDGIRLEELDHMEHLFRRQELPEGSDIA